MGIVSPNAFNEDLTTKEELMTQTMGTGPYMYAGDGDGTSYTFVRNPNYWGEEPDVDEFTVKVIADPESAVLALQSGEVDLLAGTSRLSFAGFSELSSADGIGTPVFQIVVLLVSTHRKPHLTMRLFVRQLPMRLIKKLSVPMFSLDWKQHRPICLIHPCRIAM